MKVQVEQRLINVDEYHRMGEVGILEERGIELINGKILKMSPIGTKHAACVKKIVSLLSAPLSKKAIIGVHDPIKLSDLSEPEPDISILRFDPDFYSDEHPTPKDIYLVIEVIEVSDTTGDYDREIKAPLYADALIQEYWLIDLATKQITIFQNPKDGQYRKMSIITIEGTLEIPKLNINLPAKEIL